MKRLMRIAMLILLLVLVGGCSWSTDKRISVEPKPEPIKGLYNY